MAPRSIWMKTVQESRRGMLGWSLGLAALAAMIAAVWPSIADNEQMAELFESYPEEILALFGVDSVAAFTTAEGFLEGELFAFMLPIMLIILTVRAGVRAVSGEEDAGTIDLLLATPVSRTRLVLGKFVAMVAVLTVVSGVLWVSLWLASEAVDMGIAPVNLAAAVLQLALVALFFGAFALMIGSLTGRSGLASGLSAVLAVATYFAHSLTTLVEALEIVQPLSPFYYYLEGDPLNNGFQAADAAVLAGATLVWLLVAIWGVNRRDLAT